jgi:thiamine phosphate synthase YjbQ (UPF0047 family)
MKSHTKHLTFNTRERMEFVNITSRIESEVKASGIREGLCLVNAMHITASVFINDDERGLHEDGSISARGSRSSTGSSMEDATSGCW